MNIKKNIDKKMTDKVRYKWKKNRRSGIYIKKKNIKKNIYKVEYIYNV